MILLKSDEEIGYIKAGGAILGRALGVVAKAIKPGVTTQSLDQLVEEFINDHGAKPSFKGYKGFSGSICASVNDQVVHGIPGPYVLQEGDIIAVDCGAYYKGFHSDSAFTFSVGVVDVGVKNLLDITKEALYLGIEQATVGKRIGDIGQAIQDRVYQKGYTVVKTLVGHGIGKQLHEPPQVPNYGKRGSGIKLKAGMVLAIEPMVNLGDARVGQDSDGWTIRTLDRQASAHFEHTVAIGVDKAEILTTYQYIEEALKQ